MTQKLRLGSCKEAAAPEQQRQDFKSNCWRSEYQWECPKLPRSSNLRETVLCVLLDSETRCRFSSVRIRLCCKGTIPLDTREAWEITPKTSSLSLSLRDTASSAAASDHEPTQLNEPTLPRHDAVFDIVNSELLSHPAPPGSSGSWPAPATPTCGILLLRESQKPDEGPTHTFFEFDQPLTANTQSVTNVAIVMVFGPQMALDNWSRHSSLANRSNFYSGSLSKSQLTSNRRPLDDLRRRHWRSPPEISSLADALDKRPTLGISIKFLAAEYFSNHSDWQTKLRPNRAAFTSILRAARNVNTLHIGLVDFAEANELIMALQGLSELHTFSTGGMNGNYTTPVLSAVQVITCLSTWPSLKCLILYGFSPSPAFNPAAVPRPSCRLTELSLTMTSITDDELNHFLASSSSSLERLTLSTVSGVTNAGLCRVLRTISRSLLYLMIRHSDFERSEGEEHALDTVIVHMTRLETLEVNADVGTKLMLERRSAAFESIMARPDARFTLPTTNLKIYGSPRLHSSLSAAITIQTTWSGWKITKHNPVRRPCGIIPRGE
ncbi:hypothetical protein HYDPIDRAFT_166991 [Hydnomerulius pinastri MD-312]|nr:hypothetical protein HYDPIDRAFT_166991 [Hydnomerulius pinastri MD-312]